MNRYNFDQMIDRRNTDCVKYDGLQDVFGCATCCRCGWPIWSSGSPEVQEAARKCCEQGIFGYTFRSDDGKDAFRNWVKQRYRWEVKEEWLSSSPGIVTSLAISVRAFTKSGDKVMIMTPVYPPLHAVVKDNGRELVCCPLIRDTEKYVIDWNAWNRGYKRSENAHSV